MLEVTGGKRGASACASPALVANNAEIVFASLPNPHVRGLNALTLVKEVMAERGLARKSRTG